MDKGYRYLTLASGIMLMAGFFLPWLSNGSIGFSGSNLAYSQNIVLYIIPATGIMVLFLSLRQKEKKPFNHAYAGLAVLLSVTALISQILFTDSGILTIAPSLTIKAKTASQITDFKIIGEIGAGFYIILTSVAILFLLPLLGSSDKNGREINPASYKSVVKKPGTQKEYTKFGLVSIFLILLTATYIWCGISPAKLWENRGHAKEYIFGRTLTESDLNKIEAQKKRAANIEASGRAQEYMANKYRDVPFEMQPSSAEKAKEREAVKEKFLASMDKKELKKLEEEVERNALKDLRGGYFPPETSSVKIKSYIVALIETIAIAIWGTLLAVICALPVSFLVAQNTLKLIISSDDLKARSLRNSISFSLRRFLDACRGFNEFVMALIFVAVIGLGPYAGILALWIHTFGILGKVFSEQIEAIESGQVEALTSTGAGPTQTIVFSVLPQVLPMMVSYSLLRFEANVRSAAILGFVGAGGIGFLIFDKLNGYLFREVCTMMIIIIITVGIIDYLCSRIRMRFI